MPRREGRSCRTLTLKPCAARWNRRNRAAYCRSRRACYSIEFSIDVAVAAHPCRPPSYVESLADRLPAISRKRIKEQKPRNRSRSPGCDALGGRVTRLGRWPFCFLPGRQTSGPATQGGGWKGARGGEVVTSPGCVCPCVGVVLSVESLTCTAGDPTQAHAPAARADWANGWGCSRCWFTSCFRPTPAPTSFAGGRRNAGADRPTAGCTIIRRWGGVCFRANCWGS